MYGLSDGTLVYFAELSVTPWIESPSGRAPAAMRHRWRAIQSPCAYSSHCSSPAMPRKDPTRVYEEAEPASAQAEGEDIDAVLAASAPDSAGSSAAADAGAPTNRAWLAPLARMRSRARMRACGKAAAGERARRRRGRALSFPGARSGPRSFFVPPRLFTARRQPHLCLLGAAVALARNPRLPLPPLPPLPPPCRVDGFAVGATASRAAAGDVRRHLCAALAHRGGRASRGVAARGAWRRGCV